VAKLYIRIDDSLYERLEQRALGAGLSISDLVRPLLEDAAAQGGTYIYTAHDEILALLIEVYALIATGMADRYPETLRRGTAHGQDMLRHRGLLAAVAAPQDYRSGNVEAGEGGR